MIDIYYDITIFAVLLLNLCSMKYIGNYRDKVKEAAIVLILFVAIVTLTKSYLYTVFCYNSYILLGVLMICVGVLFFNYDIFIRTVAKYISKTKDASIYIDNDVWHKAIIDTGNVAKYHNKSVIFFGNNMSYIERKSIDDNILIKTVSGYQIFQIYEISNIKIRVDGKIKKYDKMYCTFSKYNQEYVIIGDMGGLL